LETALVSSELLKEEKQRIRNRSHENNVDLLQQKLKELQEAYSFGKEHWIQSLEITSQEPVRPGIDPNDDLERETEFYSYALNTAHLAERRFEKLGLKFLRPPDYFAEMLKSDVQMDKVKDRLLASRRRIQEAIDRRKKRDLKRYGKKSPDRCKEAERPSQERKFGCRCQVEKRKTEC